MIPGRNKFCVQTDYAVIYRRNRIYLRRTKHSFKQEDDIQEHKNRTTTEKAKLVGSWRDVLESDLLEDDDMDSTKAR